MRFSKWLLTAAAAAATTAVATAQETAPPAEKAEPSQRLEGLDETVDQLLREENQPPSPAETESPAQAEPAADQPAAQPAEPLPQAAPATPPSAATPSTPPPPLSRAQIATLDRTVARGRLLIAIARAGIVATQDMLTRISDPSGAGIHGWIAEPAGNALLVTFYAAAEGEEPPKAIYRASVLGGRVTSREIFLGADRPDLNPIQARMARARAASDSDALRACTDQPFNVFVVPPESSAAAIDVYRISVPAQPGRLPLGGHFRSTVAADGSVETHAFASACPLADVPAAAGRTPPRPIAVTHLADPLPTEIHMLLAQTAGRPLLVVAGDPQRLWVVSGERIAELRN